MNKEELPLVGMIALILIPWLILARIVLRGRTK
jgi:hypothetical protein